MHKSIAIALSFLLVPCSYAAKTNASTTHANAVVKLVVGTASAKTNATLGQGTTFSTGKKSRSEIALSNGILRTGSDTHVEVTGEDAVTLHKGLALVASKPKFFRGSVRLNTPGYDLKVRGTAQVYFDPGRSIRIVVLEGDVSVALGSLRGETVKLKRGQELIINPTDKLLPTPVEVDLNRLMATMALLDRDSFNVLPSAENISNSAQKQENEITEGEELESTDIIMESAAPELELLSEEIVHEEVSDEIDDLDGDGEPDPDVAVDEDGVPLDETADGDTTGETDANGDFVDTGTDGGDAGDAGAEAPPPDRSARKKGSKGSSKPRDIIIAARKISGNNVRLGTAANPARIQITNSSQVAAIAGYLHAVGNGGNINVDASTLKAVSDITLDAGSTTNGLIQLKDSTLNATVIKARAFATGGDALIIDGSTLNADQLIQLYAEGTSTLRFRNNVTLNTRQAIIAGKTVEVDAGGNVNVSGKADIYTDNAHYNQAGYGNIKAGGGVTTQPHANRPGF